MKLFVLLIVVLLFVVWKKYQHQQENTPREEANPNSDQAGQTGPKGANPARKLLPCSLCGVHVDQATLSLNAQGEYICANYPRPKA